LLSLTATLSRLPIGRQAVWSMARRDLGMDALLSQDVSTLRPYRLDWPSNKYENPDLVTEAKIRDDDDIDSRER